MAPNREFGKHHDYGRANATAQVRDATKIRAQRRAKQKHDRRNAQLILKLLVQKAFPDDLNAQQGTAPLASPAAAPTPLDARLLSTNSRLTLSVIRNELGDATSAGSDFTPEAPIRHHSLPRKVAGVTMDYELSLSNCF